MKGSRIRSFTGVVVLAGVMIAAVGTPPAAADAIACTAREVSVSDASVLEGPEEAGNTLVFIVTATGCGAVTVQYNTVAGPRGLRMAIEGTDYVRTMGTLVFTQYETGTRKVYVRLVGEYLFEYDEGLYLEARYSAGWFPRIAVGLGTIVNDDGMGVVPESEPDCLSAPGKCTTRVRASAKASFDVLVRFSTSDGTATAGQDYIAVTQGMIVIPAGSQTGSGSVTYRQDRVMTGSEYFYINIFDPFTNEVTRLVAIIPMP